MTPSKSKILYNSPKKERKQKLSTESQPFYPRDIHIEIWQG